jgi:hypothetical protein
MPDSKVTAVLIICIAIISGVLIYKNKDYLFNSQGKTENVEVSSSNVSGNTSGDWQNLLNLSIATNSPVEILNKSTQTTDSDNSLTAQVAKSFFALYLQDQKNGVTIDQTEALRIADTVIGNLKTDSKIRQYSTVDLKISNDSTDIAVQAYKTKLASTASQDFSKGAVDPISVMDSFTKSKNEADLKKLDPMIRNYGNLIRDTLLIPVPKKFAGYQVIYLDILSSLKFDLESMRQLSNDPILGYIGFTGYQKDISAFATLINIMSGGTPQ